MKRLLILFIGLWTVACLALAVLVVLPVLQQWRAETFPTVVGAVITSEGVEVQRSTERRGPNVSYDVQLRYRYHLDGREYVGRWLRFAGWGPHDIAVAEAQRLVEQYPVDGEVTVHYDPLYLVDVHCWAYCFFCSAADFLAWHQTHGEACDYAAMKVELARDLTGETDSSWFDVDLSWLDWPDVDLSSIFDWFDVSP